MSREWALPDEIEVPSALRQAVGGHPLLARVLWRRGIADAHAAEAFLDPHRYVPRSPAELPGMDDLARLLRQAIAQGQRVRIWGDFDADGQTATAVLYEALSAAGARVDYQLPRRDEGHGMARRAIADAQRDAIDILITCDTGIGELAVVAEGVAAGLTVLITDHHDLPDALPPAQAIVNPKFLTSDHPLYELTGVGVAFMVARALLDEPTHAPRLDAMLDLVALGMVADVAKQVGDVRYLIQRGLAVLRATSRPGLLKLAVAAGLDLPHLNEQDIGFQIGPRLNAAGRLADATLAVRLLLTRDEAEAQNLVDQLEALNRDRQARTDAVLAQTRDALARDPDLARQPALVLDGEDWEEGVLGLVAGRLAQEYGRPAILISHHEGRSSVGSARSVAGIDVHQAIASQRELLLREGGHPMAAGFALERDAVERFRQGVWRWLREGRPEPAAEMRPAGPPLAIDAVVPWDEVNLSLAREVNRLAPFGAGNPRPVLAVIGGTLVRLEGISRTKDMPHRRLYLSDDAGRSLRLVWFDPTELPEAGERLDVAFTCSVNYWRGDERLQLEMVDWRPTPVATVEVAASLVAGREVVDWRDRSDAERLLAELRTAHGENLVVWAEGLPHQPAGSLTRAKLAGRRAVALAVLTPPPGPEALRWALECVQPQTLYLLPPLSVPEPKPQSFLELVAGMLHVALREREGRIEPLRMAARIGAREAAIIVALRGLEAAGRIALRADADGLRAAPPREISYETSAANNEGVESEEERAARQEAARQQARQALLYLLGETAAYRRAYRDLSLTALLQGAPLEGRGRG